MKSKGIPAALCLLAVLTGLAANAQANTSVKFSATSDCRAQTRWPALLGQIAAVAGGPGEFMVSAGDIDRCANTRSDLDAAYGAGFTWYPVIGNHERPGSGAESYYGENMDYLRGYSYGAVNPGPAGCSETTYSFDAGPVHIVCINEYWDGLNNPGSDRARDGDVVPALRAWIANDLANTSKPWKIIVGHEPAYPQADQDWGDSRHVGDSLDKYVANRDAFWAVLEQNDVTAYICGHTHRYSRYQPPGSSVWQFDAGEAGKASDHWRYDTFIMVNADENQIQFDVYRSLNQEGVFAITDSLLVPDPATLALLAAGALVLLRRRSRACQVREP